MSRELVDHSEWTDVPQKRWLQQFPETNSTQNILQHTQYQLLRFSYSHQSNTE